MEFLLYDIIEMREYLVPLDIGHKLVRLGPKLLKSEDGTLIQCGDGGYVLSQECIKKTNVVYSLGIGYTSEIERELADMGKSIYMYDMVTPEKHILTHENFYFKEMEMDAQKLTDEIHLHKHSNDDNLLLSIDIEGAEYPLFEKIDDDILLNFSQICVELHEIVSHSSHLDVAVGGGQRVLEFLKKMNKNYYLVHIHANNVIYNRPDILHYLMVEGMPDFLELTYVRKDLCKIEPTPITSQCPIEGLDSPNVNHPDVVLDWWCKKDKP